MNTAKIIRLLLSILVFCTVSCSQKAGIRTFKSTRMALGTIIEITVLDSDERHANDAIEAAFAEIERIGAEFYEGNPANAFYQFNHRSTPSTPFPAELLNLVGRSLDISRRTDGAFDITIGTLLPLYRFRGDSLQPPAQSAIAALLPYVDYRQLQVDTVHHTLSAPDTLSRLATGGIAKGYAVDRAIEILSQNNLHGAIVNAGGDLRVLARSDGKPWIVGVQDPRQPGKLLKTLAIREGSVTTSGDYQKFFMYRGKRFHHIIHPHTGLPADSCQAVTIVAPQAELADALATAMFVNGVSTGMRNIQHFPGCEALWVRHDGELFQTNGFQQYIASK